MLRKVIILIGVIFSLFFVFQNTAYSWGFFAHKKINRMAVFCLPNGMIGFYKKHIEYVSEHSVDPDKRRYVNKDEASRHYIDLEHYGDKPFDSIPKLWKKAVAKYTEDTLKAYGVVPWHIDRMLNQLTKAFQEKNTDLILRYSADLGHYVADACVPLHTTENYNGQKTNQHGIHGFWESRIPELMSENYNYWVGTAKYINDPLDKAWQIIKTSNTEVDSVLRLEATLNSTFPKDRKYSYEKRGNKSVKVYSKEYTEAYDRLLNGMVERRMRESIILVGSFWYTAWVNAGKPDLDQLDVKMSGNVEELDTLKFINNNLKGHDE